MRKVLGIISILSVIFSVSCVMAEEVTEQTKAEQIMETVSDKTEAVVEDAVDSVKYGAKKTGKFVKEKSVEVGEKTAKHAKKSAKKVKNATVRGANQITNSAAKGVKKAGQKIQSSAERTIEKTDKNIEKTTPKSECKCSCGENCQCNQKKDCE